MEKSENLGMQTFDGALFKLYSAGRISQEEALRNADSPNNVRLKIKFHDQGKGASGGGFSLSLEEIKTDDSQ
jgi:twitching motility protein PilU